MAEDINSPQSTGHHLPAFEAGDHITLSCNAAGVPYQHHAIVLSAAQHDECHGEWKLCISDFTAEVTAGDGSSGSDSGIGSFGNIGNVASNISSSPINNDEDNEANTTKPRHGLRVLSDVSSTNWVKLHYNASAPTSPPSLIRRRVQFLLKYPHLIPSYSLVESNCECVAVWCKTGIWTTLQASHMLNNTNFGSRVAIAGLSLASAVVAVPFLGVMLAAGVVTEVASGVWGDRVKRRWEERTSVLNKAFDECGTLQLEHG
mmetsp:Transcript_40406/g.84535  ORF Transcript_40406/g.84535 Transcript_40406/m.84535 type:complete len:260 (-) Transcript_40406:858-1637(-)